MPWTTGCCATPAPSTIPRVPARWGPKSDPTAVVDQYCHVHGLENIRVVDASVMPDVIRANTNATAIMIAERVSDWVNEGR